MAKSKNKLILALSTVAKKSDATRIAASLVREGLAACVNIFPGLESHYQWKNKIHAEKEFLLLMKTTARKYGLLEKRLKRLHPYDCPEIIAFPIAKAHQAYADWVKKSVS